MMNILFEFLRGMNRICFTSWRYASVSRLSTVSAVKIQFSTCFNSPTWHYSFEYIISIIIRTSAKRSEINCVNTDGYSRLRCLTFHAILLSFIIVEFNFNFNFIDNCYV